MDEERSGIMNIQLAARVMVALAGVLPGAAFAQAAWTPGSEIIGRLIEVTTNGVTNSVTLSPGGQAQILNSRRRCRCRKLDRAHQCWRASAPRHWRSWAKNGCCSTPARSSRSIRTELRPKSRTGKAVSEVSRSPRQSRHPAARSRLPSLT